MRGSSPTRTSTWPRLFAALLAALVLAGCGRAPQLPKLAGDAVVLAFGDSLTFGTGAREDQSYPAQLEQLIGRRVVRSGVPGELSAAALARLASQLDEHQPRLLILCTGGNDFLQRQPKEAAAANVRAMIRLAKDRGIDVVLIGVPDFGITLTPAGFYGDIAKEFRIPYEGDVMTKILRNSALKSDQVHPNADGYRLMAERLAALLKNAGAL